MGLIFPTAEVLPCCLMQISRRLAHPICVRHRITGGNGFHCLRLIWVSALKEPPERRDGLAKVSGCGTQYRSNWRFLAAHSLYLDVQLEYRTVAHELSTNMILEHSKLRRGPCKANAKMKGVVTMRPSGFWPTRCGHDMGFAFSNMSNGSTKAGQIAE
jgi:hypothetical protein